VGTSKIWSNFLLIPNIYWKFAYYFIRVFWSRANNQTKRRWKQYLDKGDGSKPTNDERVISTKIYCTAGAPYRSSLIDYGKSIDRTVKIIKLATVDRDETTE